MKNFTRIEWSDDLSIGNKNIDHDHKKLISICNSLVDAIESGYNNEEFARILSELTDYVLYHFEKEEQYMRQLDYPKLEEHLKSHKEFSVKVAMYNYELSQIRSIDPFEIHKFIMEWLKIHICKVDFEYEKFKRKTGRQARYRSF